MRRWGGALLAALVSGCSLPFLKPAGAIEPVFEARASVPVVTLTKSTGTVSPTDFHEDRLVVFGNGDWVARRTYPYTEPVRKQGLGAGAIRLEDLQEIVDAAFVGQPRFIDLPPSSESGQLLGAGSTTLELLLRSSTHSVMVTGTLPSSFQRVVSAIEARTMVLDLLK